jgi:hypothetical protein
MGDPAHHLPHGPELLRLARLLAQRQALRFRGPLHRRNLEAVDRPHLYAVVVERRDVDRFADLFAGRPLDDDPSSDAGFPLRGTMAIGVSLCGRNLPSGKNRLCDPQNFSSVSPIFGGRPQSAVVRLLKATITASTSQT